MRQPTYTIQQPHQFVQADLAKETSLHELCKGIDAIVHLAGVPDLNAEFTEVPPENILSTNQLLATARNSGVKRVIFASTARTIDGYRVDKQITSGMAVAPSNRYDVSKCYGEALCSFYATHHGMTFMSLRIGEFEPKDGPPPETKSDLSA